MNNGIKVEENQNSSDVATESKRQEQGLVASALREAIDCIFSGQLVSIGAMRNVYAAQIYVKDVVRWNDILTCATQPTVVTHAFVPDLDGTPTCNFSPKFGIRCSQRRDASIHPVVTTQTENQEKENHE